MDDPNSDVRELEAFKRRHQRRNISSHAAGEIFWGFGMSLVHGSTILPVFAERLGASKVLIGALMSLSVLGVAAPQLAVSYRTEGLTRKKYVFLSLHVGIFVPWAIMAALIVLVRDRRLLLLAFFVLMALYTMSIGLIIPTWADFVHRTILSRWRGRFMGFVFFLGGVGGIGGAFLARRLLEAFSFPLNFGACFASAFALVGLATTAVLFMKEAEFPGKREHSSGYVYLRAALGILRADRDFARFILAKSFLGLGGMGSAFYSVYAIETLGGPAGLAGLLTATLVGAQTLTLPLFGYVGDRKGHRLIASVSQLASLVAAIIAVIARSHWAFYLLFVMVGISFAALFVSHTNLVIELCPQRHKSTYVALANTLSAPASAIAPIMGGLLVRWMPYPKMFFVSAVLLALGLAVLQFFVREPRLRRSAAELGLEA